MMMKKAGLWFIPALPLLCIAASAEAGPVPLTSTDVTLSLHASTDGSSFSQLDEANLTGLFGPHRCQCPDTLAMQLQTTTAGLTNIGNATVGVTFLLGANCLAAPSGCTSLGQSSLTQSQAAVSSSFSSSAVFKAAAGAATVNCSSLSTGSTTIWAVLTQDGATLAFAATLAVPITTGTVSAPTAVTALPANNGTLVSWTPPKDTSLVAGYQVLCLPGPASPVAAGYEACGLVASTAAALSPADASQVCSPVVDTTSVRIVGLTNGSSYTVAVVAIDPSGGVSPLSPAATALPQETLGFWDLYKQDGGAAVACSIAAGRGRSGATLLFLGAVVGLGLVRSRRRNRLGVILVFSSAAAATTAHAQDFPSKDTDDWARVDRDRPTGRVLSPPTWGLEVGLGWYRPAIDDELSGTSQPYADTFSRSRHPMWMAELDRYIGHRFGTWGASFRAGFYRVTAKSFLADGSGNRSGDETSLRLIPLSLSAFYRLTDLPALGRLPLVPYGKLGLDAVDWTATNTGDSSSQSNVSLGWHATAGVMFSLGCLGVGGASAEGVADPFALFFEWNYAKLDGLGLTHSLQVGDSTWFAGVMFDL